MRDCRTQLLQFQLLRRKMRRRDFVKTIVALATVWPSIGHAQQLQRRRIGILTGLDEAETRLRIEPMLQELERLGWVDGRNVSIDHRVAGGNADALRKYALELVALTPDVLVGFGTGPTDHLLRATQTVPIVFTIVADPIGAGFVSSLARPSGNATGFMLFEYSLSGKWLDLLKEISPSLKRVAIIWDPTIAVGIGQFAVIQAMAPSVGLEITAIS